MIAVYHLAAIYYLPSWQGGDTMRPLCHMGRSGVHDLKLVTSPKAVTCWRCRRAIAGVEIPNVRPRTTYTPRPEVFAREDHARRIGDGG